MLETIHFTIVNVLDRVTVWVRNQASVKETLKEKFVCILFFEAINCCISVLLTCAMLHLL